MMHIQAACERVMHVFTTQAFVSLHNGGEEADCGRSGLEERIKSGDLEEDERKCWRLEAKEKNTQYQ